MKFMHNRTTALSCAAALLALIMAGLVAAADYEILGKIESIRKGNRITVLFREKPQKTTYLILRGGETVGSVEVLSIGPGGREGFTAKAECFYSFNNPAEDNLGAGDDVALVIYHGPYKSDYDERQRDMPVVYLKTIVTPKDGREMVLIPEGKFFFGNNNGDRDEYPEQLVFLGSYYMDRYEVSNRDFYLYMKATRSPAPITWNGSPYDESREGFPVQVTYNEALGYARWAGKRLPIEEEWEKAARGMYMTDDGPTGPSNMYPWGDRFDPEKANTAEFWSSATVGLGVKRATGLDTRSFIPVDSLPAGASVFGVMNMSGNAMEWTSSWYRPYKGNRKMNGKYGTQYKVMRGGDYLSDRFKSRTTNREVGGAPTLYHDFVAGFRCVRDALPTDKERP
jgi:formylglycine-generating enzyme required for sulfatase activity